MEPNSSFLASNPWVPVASDFLSQNSASAQKAKLLCSFGGKILPRPNDSSLRYIGGETRLISIQKDITFPELMRKLATIVINNEQENDPSSPRPVSVKYQLPGEDLDALVSVSCQEDLENMIEEYDKLSLSCSDGLAKLRVFLFPPAEPDLASIASGDSSLKYISAINSGLPSTDGIKDSVASAGSSTHNSDSMPLQDNSENVNEIMSPPVQSPTIAYLDQNQNPVPAHPQPVPVAGYLTPQGFVEAQQLAYLNPHQIAPNMPINVVPVTVPVTTTQQVVPKPVQPVVQPVQPAQPVVQPVQASDPNSYKVLQPLSQLPPLPGPVYLQTQTSDKYATRTATQILPQRNPPVIQYDDCAMCQKALPHAHSDNMVPELGTNTPHPDQNQNPVFYSLHPDYAVKQSGPIVTTNPVTNLVTTNPISTIPVSSVVTGQLGSDPTRVLLNHDPFHLTQAQTQQPYWSTMNPSMYHMILNNANYQHQTAHPVQNYDISQNFMQAVNMGTSAPLMDPKFQGQVLVNPVPDNPLSQMRPQVAGPVLMNPVPNPVQQLPAVSVKPLEPSIIASNNNVQYSSNHGAPVYTMDMHDQFVPPQAVNNKNVIQPVNTINNALQRQPVNTVNNVIQPQVVNNESESLFSNHDPWNQIGGNGNLMPPMPTRLAATKDPVVENNNNLGVMANGSNIVSLLEEGNLPRPEPATVSKGSGEDSVKRQLQAVAENVAASVLQSSLSGGNNSFDKEPVPILPPNKADIERVLDAKEEVQEMKNHQLDKVNPGVPLVDDIGHLQIIKNSDLEELRELGSGTFGTVYHGKWRGTDVAIKRINDRCFAGKPSEQERMRADFWNEACKLASLHHPNVVAFYGLVLDGPGGSVATVTEYMANGSLRQALQRNDKMLDRRRRLVIAMDVAFGMEYLHGKNIVHFDLKSDNLLVNLRDPQRPICKVGDLGLSKVKCQTLISGGVRGTLPWMAPELLNGSSSLVSEKVDVFSFGIVMWELLTGDEPYTDLHYGAIIGGIVNNTLRPAIPETCDPDWRSLMEQCWSTETSQRPSFTEVVNRLRSMATALSKQPQK